MTKDQIVERIVDQMERIYAARRKATDAAMKRIEDRYDPQEAELLEPLTTEYRQKVQEILGKRAEGRILAGYPNGVPQSEGGETQ